VCVCVFITSACEQAVGVFMSSSLLKDEKKLCMLFAGAVLWVDTCSVTRHPLGLCVMFSAECELHPVRIHPTHSYQSKSDLTLVNCSSVILAVLNVLILRRIYNRGRHTSSPSVARKMAILITSLSTVPIVWAGHQLAPPPTPRFCWTKTYKYMNTTHLT
jgi:hypothetical protein